MSVKDKLEDVFIDFLFILLVGGLVLTEFYYKIRPSKKLEYWDELNRW